MHRNYLKVQLDYIENNRTLDGNYYFRTEIGEGYPNFSWTVNTLLTENTKEGLTNIKEDVDSPASVLNIVEEQMHCQIEEINNKIEKLRMDIKKLMKEWMSFILHFFSCRIILRKVKEFLLKEMQKYKDWHSSLSKFV